MKTDRCNRNKKKNQVQDVIVRNQIWMIFVSTEMIFRSYLPSFEESRAQNTIDELSFDVFGF